MRSPNRGLHHAFLRRMDRGADVSTTMVDDLHPFRSLIRLAWICLHIWGIVVDGESGPLFPMELLRFCRQGRSTQRESWLLNIEDYIKAFYPYVCRSRPMTDRPEQARHAMPSHRNTIVTAAMRFKRLSRALPVTPVVYAASRIWSVVSVHLLLD